MATIVQDLNRIEDVLKNEYLSFLNNAINVEPSIFMEKIKKSELTAAEGRFGARIGVGGGFGMSGEGLSTPSANAPLYGDFKYTTKDAYCDIQLSHKVVKLGQGDTAVLKNAVKDAMDASYEAAKWNTSRMLFGNGSGKLCKITSVDTNNYSDNISTFTVDSTENIIEGLVVDIYTWASGAATAGTLANTNKAVQIIAINHATKTVTVTTDDIVITQALTADNTNYGFLTVQGSYNREITGLGSIFDSGVTSIYDVTKSQRPSIVPYTVSAANDINDILITQAIQRTERTHGGKIDLLMFGDEAYSAYLTHLRETNTTYTVNNNYRGGFASIKLVYGNREVDVYNERFVPKNSVWGVDTAQYELRQTGWDFAAYQSSIFNLINGTSVYRALLANYMELVCKHPGANFEITNANAA